MKERRIKNLMYRNRKENLEGIKQSGLPCVICGWANNDTITNRTKRKNSLKRIKMRDQINFKKLLNFESKRFKYVYNMSLLMTLRISFKMP